MGPPSVGECMRADVNRVDLESLFFQASIQQSHGDGIRLLAGAAARAPDAEPAPSFAQGTLPEFRNPLLREIIEVVWLAEKAGDIGGERVDEAGHFIPGGILTSLSSALVQPEVPYVSQPQLAEVLDALKALLYAHAEEEPP